MFGNIKPSLSAVFHPSTHPLPLQLDAPKNGCEDALCIIQDDDDDWGREAHNMAAVYSLAHLIIAATRSPNHEAGCFSKTNPQFRTHKVTVLSVGNNELTLLFR